MYRLFPSSVSSTVDEAYRYSKLLLYIIVKFTPIAQKQIKVLFSNVKNKVIQMQGVEY